jgi:ATP-binding cassette subfamily B protein
MEHDKKLNYKFFWELVTPFKGYIFTILSVGLVWSAFIIAKATALKIIIDYLTTGRINEIHWPVGVYLGAWFFNEFCWRIRDYSIMYFKPYLKKHIMVMFSNRMMEYEDHYFQKHPATSLMHGLRNVFDGVEDGVFAFEEFFTHVVLIISTCFSMFIINLYFGLISLAWLVIWGISAVHWSKKGYNLSFKVYETRNRFTTYLGDVFSHMSIVKVFNGTTYEKRATNKKADEVAESEVKKEKMFFTVWIIQGITFLIVLTLILWVLISEYKKGKVTVGDFAMILELVQTIYLYLFDLAKDIAEASETLGRIQQGLDLIYKKIKRSQDQTSLPDLVVEKGEIIFDHVTYKYPNADPALAPFFANNCIKIEAGSTVAVVGPSGGGKTTLIKMLLRLFDPHSGTILIDGQDILKHNKTSVRNAFGFVPQDLGLFQRSIEENIKYGSFKASSDEIKEVSKKSGADDFIMKLPDGYKTELGAKGDLSGGQKQRLMIARGLLRQAKIFVFDESTSALDVETESNILKSIKELTPNCTKIIIAHRLKTVEKADLILVCDKGSIVEQGNHEQLMHQNGLYAKLYKMI